MFKIYHLSGLSSAVKEWLVTNVPTKVHLNGELVELQIWDI